MELSNNHKLPQSFVDVINQITYDPTTRDPKRLGVTTLIGSPRVKLLTVRHWSKLTEDVADHLWRIMGSAVHYVLEKATSEDRLTEEKFVEDVGDGFTIVAKPDIYDKVSCSVEDYKFTSVWAVMHDIKTDWVNQLNCYAWLLRKRGYEVKELWVDAIVKDWRRGEQRKYDDYPAVPFKRIKLPLWTFEEQEIYIKERLEIYKNALPLADDDLPECTSEERWARPDTYAVMKNANKRATRVLDSREDAEGHIAWLQNKDQKSKYTVVKRPGSNMRCEEYCLMKDYCSQYKKG